MNNIQTTSRSPDKPIVQLQKNAQNLKVPYISNLADLLTYKGKDKEGFKNLENRVTYIQTVLNDTNVTPLLSGLEKCILACCLFFASIETALGVEACNNHGFKAYNNRATAYIQKMRSNDEIGVLDLDVVNFSPNPS